MSDLRDAIRSVFSSPIVTTAAVLSLALGIGANTALFSIVNSVLLRPLPVREPERLMLLGIGEEMEYIWTSRMWDELRNSHANLFDGMVASNGTRFDIASGGPVQQIDAYYVSASYFAVLDVRAVLGRVFTAEDEARDGGADGPVTVISHEYWQRRFNGDVDVIGRTMTIERVTFTIVGVTPAGFYGLDVGDRFDVLVPLGMEPRLTPFHSRIVNDSEWLTVMVRLRQGQSVESLASALRAVQRPFREATLPAGWPLEEYIAEPFRVQPAATGTSYVRYRFTQPLVVLSVVAVLVLLIACANIANLMLARAVGRRREFGVRLALGAPRWRLARQVLVESLVVAGAGAMIGLMFAQWGAHILLHQFSTDTFTVRLDLPIDWRVTAFTVVATGLTALLSGTVPALRASRSNPLLSLRATADAPAGGWGMGSALVAAQVGLSVVLLVAAGLFIRTFVTLSTGDSGFVTAGLMTVHLDGRHSGLAPADRVRTFEEVRKVAATVPAVSSAVVAPFAPFNGGGMRFPVDLEGAAPRSGRDRMVWGVAVSPGWFVTVGPPLAAGRDFTDRDTAQSPPVAIVNEEFVRVFLGGAPPLGRLFRGGQSAQPAPVEIVGLARNAHYRTLRQPVLPLVFLPVAQATNREAFPFATLIIRTQVSDPALLARPLTAAIGSVNRDLSLTFQPYATRLRSMLVRERSIAVLSAFFGGLALLLSAVGLYGVTAYNVHRRRREIGVRIALGAVPGMVIRLVIRRVAVLVAIGALSGAVVALWAARLVESLLFGLEARDPATTVMAVSVLAAVAAFAAWLPARRAARLDPSVVLREGGNW